MIIKGEQDMIIKGELEPFAKTLRGCSKRNLGNWKITKGTMKYGKLEDNKRSDERRR